MFSTTVRLGGQDRVIKVNYNSVCLIERVTGAQLLLVGQAWASARMLTAMLWAGLHHADLKAWSTPDAALLTAEPTLEQVGDWIDEAGPQEVTQSIYAAWERSLPQPEPVTDAKPSAEAAEAGPLPG